MFGSLTPLLLTVSGLKSGTGIIFHQASRHAHYSTALTVLLCESLKIVLSSSLLARSLYKQGQPTSAGTSYSRLQTDDPDSSSSIDSVAYKEARTAQEDVEPKLRLLAHQVFSQVFAVQGLRLMVPAIIYVVQNNLYLYAASELDPAFFQALWQMRILVSAVLSCFVLKRVILRVQWLCICGIFCGVLLVKFATMNSQVEPVGLLSKQSALAAPLALCAAAILSSTAGVILEIIFRDAKVNLWASNVQLSAFSVLPAACIVVFSNTDFKPVVHDLGHSPWPLGVVLCQSMNGMLIALLLKKAGVIINDLTSAVSIILTFALNSTLFPSKDRQLGFGRILLVVLGSIVILVASITYNKFSAENSEAEAQPTSAEESDESDSSYGYAEVEMSADLHSSERHEPKA